jgi:hypothetical protein
MDYCLQNIASFICIALLTSQYNIDPYKHPLLHREADIALLHKFVSRH